MRNVAGVFCLLLLCSSAVSAGILATVEGSAFAEVCLEGVCTTDSHAASASTSDPIREGGWNSPTGPYVSAFVSTPGVGSAHAGNGAELTVDYGYLLVNPLAVANTETLIPEATARAMAEVHIQLEFSDQIIFHGIPPGSSLISDWYGYGGRSVGYIMVGACEDYLGTFVKSFRRCDTPITSGVPITISAQIGGFAFGPGPGAGGVVFVDSMRIQPPGGLPPLESVYYTATSGHRYAQIEGGLYVIPEPGTWILVSIALGLLAMKWRRFWHVG